MPRKVEGEAFLIALVSQPGGSPPSFDTAVSLNCVRSEHTANKQGRARSDWENDSIKRER